MANPADPDHPIHELISRRFSPTGFADRDVSDEDLRSLFEAARWAPSSRNEQPWSFLVATRRDPEGFARILSCLVTANRAWAKAAPVLALAVARRTLSRNGKPNDKARHDLGLATATLTLEATARGLFVHPMGGIDPERAREIFEVPEDHEVVTGLAIGHLADPAGLPDELRRRDTAPRRRKGLSEIVFSGRWGETAGLVR